MVGDDDPALIAEVLALYVVESTQLLSEIRRYLEAGEMAAMIRSAHTLKPSSAIVGAHQIVALSEQLEQLGRTSARDLLAATFAELEAEHARFVAQLKAES